MEYYYLIGSDVTVPQQVQNLTSSSPEACFNVTLISDDLIEETETVTLTLSLEPTNTIGVRDVAPSTTLVTVTDGDCESLFPSYMILYRWLISIVHCFLILKVYNLIQECMHACNLILFSMSSYNIVCLIVCYMYIRSLAHRAFNYFSCCHWI